MNQEANKQHGILVVDDEPKNLKLICDILKNYGYGFETAMNDIEALEKIKDFSPDLIFLDIMNGYDACRRMKDDPETRHIPVVMVTALSDRESRSRGLESGANDFLTKPFDATEIMVRIRNLLGIKEFEDSLKRQNEMLTLELKKSISEVEQSRDKMKDADIDTIHRLAIVAEYKDEETASHIKRVGYYCRLVAKGLGWTEEEQEAIFYASPMHDIGKVGIPSDILLKPAKLSPEEFALMKSHTVIGARIFNGSPSRILQMAERIALSHHERWDGSGYPRGLKEVEIPIEGCIMNIADQYDALRSTRPYKLPFDHERAFKIITEGDGQTMPRHFDPQVLQVFKDSHRQFDQIYDTFHLKNAFTRDS